MEGIQRVTDSRRVRENVDLHLNRFIDWPESSITVTKGSVAHKSELNYATRGLRDKDVKLSFRHQSTVLEEHTRIEDHTPARSQAFMSPPAPASTSSYLTPSFCPARGFTSYNTSERITNLAPSAPTGDPSCSKEPAVSP